MMLNLIKVKFLGEEAREFGGEASPLSPPPPPPPPPPPLDETLSRQNFATNVMHKLFTKAKRETSNVNGVLGKAKLDVDKVECIKSITIKMCPLDQKKTQKSAWSKCRGAIDEANRRLYRPK